MNSEFPTTPGPHEIDPASAWLRRGWGPVEAGTSLTVLRAEAGHVLFSAHTGDADAGISHTVLGALADSGSAVTAFSAVGPRATGPTVDLRFDIARPVSDGAHLLFAEGRVLQVSETAITTRLVIRDDRDVVVGHVLGTHGVEEDPTQPEDSWPDFDHPLTRGDLKLSSSGGDVLADVRPSMLNGRGGLHGGVLLAIAHQVHLEHYRSEGIPVRPLHVEIDYRKPADLSGPIRCSVSAERSGRRFRSVSIELKRADGVTVAVARGSAALDAAR